MEQDGTFDMSDVVAPPVAHARFAIGDVVRHRLFDFRGVVFDIDLGAFTASLFVDGAWVDNVGPNDPAPDWIASVGASLLWTPSDALSARLTYGESLRRPLLVGRRDLQDRGIQFMITVRPLAFFAGR